MLLRAFRKSRAEADRSKGEVKSLSDDLAHRDEDIANLTGKLHRELARYVKVAQPINLQSECGNTRVSVMGSVENHADDEPWL